MKKLLLIIVVFFLTFSISKSEERYWISPASVRKDFWEMFKPEAKWDTLLSQIHVFSIHINAFDANRLDTNLVKSAAKKLNDADVKINLECGGLRPFSGCDSLAGEHHAQTEMANMRKWLKFGGKIDFVTMDSPINTMIEGGDPNGTCNWTVERAAFEMVDYMKAVRKLLPEVVFALVEPVPWYSVGTYPNHPGNNYGDLLNVMDTVLNVVKSRSENLEIFHSDSPYEYSDNKQTQGWLKLKALEDWLHSKGIKHGRINNSQDGGFQSGQLFYERTLESWKKYDAVGGGPDEIEVWCWYDNPAINAPEWQPYTFTFTCRKLIELAEGKLPQNIKARFEPDDGKVYHGVQTFGKGHEGYINALNDSTILPYVHGLFLSIPGTRDPEKNFISLRQHLDNANKEGFMPEYGLFLVVSNADPHGATDSIIAVSDKYDYLLDSIIAISKEYGKRMMVRIGGEFNGNWNGGGYKPHYYVKAFRKIVDMYKSAGIRDSVAFNWCYEPDAADDFDHVDSEGPLWYPGDDYVDWFGLDLFYPEHFNQSLPDSSRGKIAKKGKSERFLAMARNHNKPVFLNELSAVGVTITSDSADGVKDWNSWFAPFFEFLDNHPEVKGFNYTDQDWEHTGYPGWGDGRIEINKYITSKYREEMHKPRYIHIPKDVEHQGQDSTGLIPLTDMGSSFYMTFDGGLYPNFSNERPAEHNQAGLKLSNEITPLNVRGEVDSANGKIVLLSIGMSICSQEFSKFKSIADTFSFKNPKVIIIDGAQGGQTADIISNSSATFWDIAEQRLNRVGANKNQVQVVWLKEANHSPKEAFPGHAFELSQQLKTIAKILKNKYPNIKLTYVSSRTYGGYAVTALNPEPFAYESGFSVKWLIESQINGDTALTFDGAAPKAPWLAWGPYLWADGMNARSDGLFFERTDFGSDGTHPSDKGCLKNANMLFDFFKTDETAKIWFLKKTPTSVNESILQGMELFCYPNPMNQQSVVSYQLPVAGRVMIDIYNSLGSKITTLVDEFQEAGSHSKTFEAGNLPQSMYYYTIRFGEWFESRKLMIIK